jgi:hypothetical protein
MISVISLRPIIIEALASSPSFPRQVEVEPPHDWRYFPLTPHSNCTAIGKSVQIPHMVGASYFSDGNTLNATIWLSGPFQKVPFPLIRSPTYSMDIGIVQSYNTNVKVDYADMIQWDGLSSTWTRTIQEFLANSTRTLLHDNNYTSFDNTGNNGHVNFSLDLRKVSSPTQYFVVFLALDAILQGGNSCGLVDVIGHQIYIPPPDFRISVVPNPTELTQGEERTLELRVNSSTLVKPLFSISKVNAPPGLEISINPNRTYIPPEGIATSFVKVKATDNVDLGPKTIALYPNVSFPVTIDVTSLVQAFSSKVIGKQSPNNSMLNVNNISSSINPRPAYFSVIVKSYPFQEQFKDFWNAYGGVIGLIGGGFAAGFSALIIDRFNRRSKTKFSKNDDSIDSQN